MVSILHESTASVWAEDAVSLYDTFEPRSVSVAAKA